MEFKDTSTVSKGSTKNNLRTTLPKIVKEALNVTYGDKLEWTVNVKSEEKVIVTILKEDKK